MHTLKASLYNKEKRKMRELSSDLQHGDTLTKSASQAVFSKPSKLHS